MRRVKRKFLIVAGLFISGLNPLWATSSEKLTAKTEIIGKSNASKIQKNKEFLYALSSNNDLSLPSRSSDVIVKSFKKINLDELEKILINNNRTVKVYLKQVDQAQSILKSSLSSWYPTLNLTANGIPQYFESNNYFDSNLIQDLSLIHI